LDKAYASFDEVIQAKSLKIGVEVGVASGDHAKAILSSPAIERLYGVDPYRHRENYHSSLNLPQNEFNELYLRVLKRLARFGQRYKHVRELPKQAVSKIPGQIDFVYINAECVYVDVWEDLCVWFPKVREGGVLGGNHYDHPDFPNVKQGVDRFFRKFDWEIQVGGRGAWWVKKLPRNISFFMPVYNCAGTIRESVESIMEGNFSPGDELVIVDDDSTDNTEEVLHSLQEKYPEMRVFKHIRNKGGGAARNTAIENCRHPLLFCLDSDNVLVPGSIQKLKGFLESTGADVVAFERVHFFRDDKANVTHKWKFREHTTLADCLSCKKVPGSSGNYMFHKASGIAMMPRQTCRRIFQRQPRIDSSPDFDLRIFDYFQNLLPKASVFY